MKKHYDFSKAQQGKLYRPSATLKVPVYLDDDVQKALSQKRARGRKSVTKFVNDVLRQRLDMVD